VTGAAFGRLFFLNGVMVELRSPHNPTPQKITFGEMRESGCRDVLIY
jgi:hypothetical protein